MCALASREPDADPSALWSRRRMATRRNVVMRIVRRHGWEIAESLVTPEHAAVSRRSLLGSAIALTILPSLAAQADVALNPAFKPGRAVTEEKYSTTYNNYYEFSESKNLWQQAQSLKTSPWSIEFAGLVKQPRKIGLE